jgi:hypothetical protein
MGIDNFKMYIDLLSNILLSYGQGLFDRYLEYANPFQNALCDSMHHMSSHGPWGVTEQPTHLSRKITYISRKENNIFGSVAKTNFIFRDKQ